jgi:hypothetical protein
MDSGGFEIESEAWFRAVAEGRILPVTDRPRDPRRGYGEWIPPNPVKPPTAERTTTRDGTRTFG